ncbi:LysM peptidoglycan-binding domain-containing protein [Kribbella sp. NPDC048915]|uniref:LysM peptidoglycan-binding domain-containing protein n=1 Tax=Kribbella sp. NPDC048915 TaxID=3155148 RepID=UPI0033D43AEC
MSTAAAASLPAKHRSRSLRAVPAPPSDHLDPCHHAAARVPADARVSPAARVPAAARVSPDVRVPANDRDRAGEPTGVPAHVRERDEVRLAGRVPATMPRRLRVVSPAPQETHVAPRRRVRIEGAVTEPLSVRACAGESLGREARVESAPLRLTRRGRLLVTTLSVFVFGAAILVLGLRVAGVLEPGPNFTHTVPVQVAPGETLWSIAQSTNPGHDPAIVVEKIADLNKLDTPADVVPGQTLQIPIAN